jgi:hypothetical protein
LFRHLVKQCWKKINASTKEKSVQKNNAYRLIYNNFLSQNWKMLEKRVIVSIDIAMSDSDLDSWIIEIGRYQYDSQKIWSRSLFFFFKLRIIVKKIVYNLNMMNLKYHYQFLIINIYSSWSLLFINNMYHNGWAKLNDAIFFSRSWALIRGSKSSF